MSDLPPDVAKTLLHLDAWFDDVEVLIGHGREAFLRGPLLRHAADSLLSKVAEPRDRPGPRLPGAADQRPCRRQVRAWDNMCTERLAGTGHGSTRARRSRSTHQGAHIGAPGSS